MGTLKKYRTLIIVVWMIILFLVVSGIHIPFIVLHIQKQIKVAQHAADVGGVIADNKIQPALCLWRIEGTEKPVFSDRIQCEFPSDKIPLDGNGSNFELMLVYAGPGFLKNELTVNFDNAGNVTFVSDVRRWD